MSEENIQLQRILEGAIMAAGEPLSIDRMGDLFIDESAIPEKADMIGALKQLQQKYQENGFELVEVASGWRFQVKEDLATWVNRLWEEKPQKYSKALLETLALIAYRQPITRGDIEEVRGVAVSSHIIKTLSERDWVKVVGHRDVPGRPALYATTRHFLDYFNLQSLEQLPSLGELQDIESLNADLQFDGASIQTNEDHPSAQEGDETGNVDTNEESSSQTEFLDEYGEPNEQGETIHSHDDNAVPDNSDNHQEPSDNSTDELHVSENDDEKGSETQMSEPSTPEHYDVNDDIDENTLDDAKSMFAPQTDTGEHSEDDDTTQDDKKLDVNNNKETL